MSKLRILLADDHTLVRHGFKRILEERPEWTIVAEASEGREAVRLAVETQPDVAILDVAMPQMNGIDAAAQIVRWAPSVQILMLSMHSEDACISRALRAGARGYLLKE